MRLIDLEPRWALDADIWVGGLLVHDVIRKGMGLTFECPHCRSVRIGVFFANPVDGKLPSDDSDCLWTRTGETFDTLTVAPSIDAQASGHWHGTIVDGEVT